MNGKHQHRRYFISVPIVELDPTTHREREVTSFAHLDWVSQSDPSKGVRIELAPYPVMSFEEREDAELGREALIAVLISSVEKTLCVSAGNQSKPGVFQLELIRVVELDVTYTWEHL